MSIPAVFISYSHLDEPWKDRLVKHLGVAEKQGLLRTWNDRDILGGDDWFAEIINAIERGSVAVLLVSHNSLTSGFILNEEAPRMLARHKVQAARFYPIVVEYCDWEAVEWLKRFNLRPRDARPVGINKQGERTEEQINLDLTEIAKEIRLAPPLPAASAAPEPLIGECPYLGLEAFTEDKEHLFFGRADFADALFAKVKRQNFVALVGPSGCGKSSVVQAGLFPRLRRDAQKWETILFPPREDPFLSLAAGFVWRWQPQANYVVNTNEAKKLAAELKDEQGLIEAIHRTVAAHAGRLLLVIDQFEEMFTLCDESARHAFLDILLAAKDVAPVTILLTLRADFMGQAQSFSSAFSHLLDESIVSHRPLTRADLEAVITGPARHSGLEFEPGLVSSILQEVAAQPDSLPLLEYALKEMWRKRQSQVMGHALYEAVGKVEGAISQHADAVLHTLPEAERALALRALTWLVRVAGEEGEADTRLRLPLSELPEAERDVLQTFITARLLVTRREEGAGVETIEVAHESLIRRWEKLRKALDSDREFLTWRRRLDSRRKAWEQKGRDEKWLLYGGERDDALRWLNERRAELTAAEFEFITWDNRTDFQIERILSESPSLLPYSNNETHKSWFATLVFCREKEKALSIARDIEAAGSRARALSFITPALVKIGLATEALAVAQEIEDSYCRAKALSSIARMLVRVGMAKEARETVTKALAAAREIENTKYRAMRLSSIADALVKAGMVTEALGAAREIEDASRRAMALHSIASEMLEAGMVTEALGAAREIEDASRRAMVLLKVTDFWLERRQDDDAWNLLEETQSAVSKVVDDETRSWLMRDLAVILARLHSYRAAREAAEQCSISEDRLAAYTAILREYHIERDPSLARLFVEEEEED